MNRSRSKGALLDSPSSRELKGLGKLKEFQIEIKAWN